MATTLKILGWSAKGLRCPDHDLSFENGEGVYKISLIQMPNGTGKTTTLKLLRAALTGPTIWDGSFEVKAQFRKNHTEHGQFELRLLHNERRLTIIMQFDFDNDDEVKYYTVYVNGKEDGFYPPIELRPFLSPEFVKLLVFDGELASHLLDARYTNAEQAIIEMYQLSFFPTMKTRIEEYWSDMAQSFGSRGGTKELTRRSNRVAALKSRLKYVKGLWDTDRAEHTKIKTTIKKLESESRDQLEKNKQDALQMKEAESVLALSRQLLATKSHDLTLLMKNPVEFSQYIATSVYELKESLDRVKLPGKAAREFFDEIAEEPFCICGREIDPVIKQVIKAGAMKYLGSEEMNVINAMKTDIKNRFSDGQIHSGQVMKQAIQELEAAQDEEILAQQNIDVIRLSAGNHNPEIESIQLKIIALTRSLGELENEMEKYEDQNDDSDDSWNLEILANRARRAEEELADTTGTLVQKKKKDILHIILDEAFQNSKAMLSEGVCEEANKKIKILMPDNEIRIEKIDKCLRLVGKEGGSVGETLSVGYAFLSSLLSNTEHSLPSIVDSPTGAIDLSIRPEIARLIPGLADQFIAFTISSERQNFISLLVKEASQNLHFITMFKKGNKQLEKSARETANYNESEDGIWVAGKEFFEQFHPEIE